ncbi:hypothetical protein GJ496_006657 [Pomphorhynchus laevis]|nr:hypothetical protein GJ496_006657 [Pomphorhynchus laevis]
MSLADIDLAINQAADQRYKQLTKQELIRSLVKPFDRFDVHASKFTYDNGKEKTLVKLEGILPVTYRGVLYNIPIMMWLSDDFPYDPPICYVRPIHNMVLSEQCSVIDRNGRVVRLSTLKNWHHDRTTLTDIFRDMAIQFGQNPPVFSKKDSPPLSRGNLKDKSSPKNLKTPPSLPEEILRKSLVSAVLDKARRKFISTVHEQKSEIAILKKTENDLIAGGKRLNELMNAMSVEEQRLSGYITTVREKNAEISSAIDRMTSQVDNSDVGQILTQMFVPSTQLYSQIVKGIVAVLSHFQIIYVLQESFPGNSFSYGLLY